MTDDLLKAIGKPGCQLSLFTQSLHSCWQWTVRILVRFSSDISLPK